MIRRKGQFQSETRREMRGGSGSVKIEHFWQPVTEMKSPVRLCARLTLKPGDSIGFRRHDDEEEIFIVAQGRAEMDDDGVKEILETGDTIITGGAGHAVKSLGPEDLELIAFIIDYKQKHNSSENI